MWIDMKGVSIIGVFGYFGGSFEGEEGLDDEVGPEDVHDFE